MTNEQIRSAIFTWATRETGLKFIFADQDAPRPQIPYGEITFRNATRKVGAIDEFRVGEESGFTMNGQREGAFDIEIIGKDANEKMSLLRDTLDRPDVIDELPFAHIDEDGPFDLTSLEETKTRERSRLTIGIRYGIEKDVNENVGTIEEVEIEIEGGPLDGEIIEIEIDN